LENLSDSEDINRAWESIQENNKTPAKESLDLHELKQHKPRVDEECLRTLDQRKQTKIHWLQDPNQSSVDNLDNVKGEASTYFRNKKKKYLRAKIDEFDVKYDERRNISIPFIV
jgi:hypothetical protein